MGDITDILGKKGWTHHIENRLIRCGWDKSYQCRKFDCDCQGEHDFTYICELPICYNERCIRKRMSRKKHLFLPRITEMTNILFLTLTFKGYYPLEKHYFIVLNKAFKRMIFHIRQKVKLIGYFRCFELVPHEYFIKKESKIVHYYHIHAILNVQKNEYLNVWDMKAKWEKLTGSYIVDIRKGTSQEAVFYLLQYLKKSSVLDASVGEYFGVRRTRFFLFSTCRTNRTRRDAEHRG